MGAQGRDALFEFGEHAFRLVALPVPCGGGIEAQEGAAGADHRAEGKNGGEGGAEVPVHDEDISAGQPDHAAELDRDEQARPENAVLPGKPPGGKRRHHGDLVMGGGGNLQDDVEGGRLGFRQHRRADPDGQRLEPDQDQAEEQRDEEDPGDRGEREGFRRQHESRKTAPGARARDGRAGRWRSAGTAPARSNPRGAGGPGDNDAHQIEADQDQEAGEGQKAEADKMAKRRGFPCQAKRVALDDGSQGQLQRREF